MTFPNPNRRQALGLIGATALGSALPAVAQSTFPSAGRPIRIIVAFPPGAGPDALARMLLPSLAQSLGVPVIIENKPGAGTVLAAQEVMRSAADGHTLFFSASSTMVQAPHTLKAATYDPMTAFTPISMGARGPLVLIVNAELGIHNVQELIAWGKANPTKLSYGSFGTGTSSHIFGQVFAKNTGLPMEHIPYKGGAEIAADLVAGRLPMAFDAAPAAIQTAKTGKARIIAVCAPTRNPSLPNVPTLTEQGVKDIDLNGFIAWFGPAGLKPDVVAKVRGAIVQAMAPADVRKQYAETAYVADPSTPEELADEVRRSFQAWGALVQRAGIEKQ